MNPNVITITTVTQTTRWCPSQFEGVTSAGRELYARHRGGNVRVYLNYWSEAKRETIFEGKLGGPMDGSMTYEELVALTSHLIEWPKELTPEEPYGDDGLL